MKKIAVSLTVLLFLTLVFAVPMVSAQKPKPIPKVMGIFKGLSGLEEGFRGGEWDEALEVVEKIEADFGSLTGELKGKVDDRLIKKFTFIVTVLKKELASKDAERVEKPSIKLQELLLDIMNHFDYPDPPILLMADQILEEAGEEAEEKNYENTAEEMDEIEAMKGVIIKALKDKGVSAEKAVEFFKLAGSVEDLAEAKNGEAIEDILKKMETILSSAMSGN